MKIVWDSGAEAFISSCRSLGLFSQGASESEAAEALIEANQMIASRLNSHPNFGCVEFEVKS